MVLSGLVLFLFGTAVSAGPLLAHKPTEIIVSKNTLPSRDRVVEYLPSRGQSPFISNFIQEGTNVFFKPQFVMSAAQMPPQVQTLVAEIEKDCKTPYPMGPMPGLPIVEESLRVIEKEVIASPNIREVIDIKPMAIPRPIALPKLPLLVEEPCVVEQILVPEAPLQPVYIPEVVMPGPRVPVVMEIEESKAPVVIPSAPILPPLEMPRLPVMVEEVPFVAPLPDIPMIIEMEQPKEIVVLPQMDLPKLPLVPEPCDTVEVVEERIKPIAIPEAPLLPPLAPIEIPAPAIIEEPVSFEIQKEIVTPVVLPPAPVLTPLVLPELPVPCETVEIIEEHVQPMVVPEAPLLPPLGPLTIPTPIFVEQPMRVEIEKDILKPVVLPPVPVSTAFVLPESPNVMSVPCETVEIIEEHLQPMVVPEAPLLPPMGPLTIPTPIIVEKPMRVEMEKEVLRPVVLPSAPALSPLEMPKLPIMVQRPAEVVLAPCPPEQEIIMNNRPFIPMPFAYSELSLTKPVIVPSAPMVSEYYLPNIVKEGSVMVENNSLLSIPPVQDIVVGHILPKMETALKSHFAKGIAMPFATVSKSL